MYAIFVVGTAGSGKSLLSLNLAEWYKTKGAHSITVNLDPGALSLPYEPDVDVRQYIDLQQVMENYGLGPNGAMIFSCDLIATKLSELQDEVDELKP
ncbi:MAG: ATP/GTP-binding protein, partial [Nitrososphaerales archaeon]